MYLNIFRKWNSKQQKNKATSFTKIAFDCIIGFAKLKENNNKKTAIAKVSSTFGRSFSWAVAAIKKWTLVPWWIQLSFLKLCRLAFVKPHRTLSPNSEQQTPSCKLLSSKAEKQNPSYTIRAATSEHMWIQDTDFLYPHHTCVYIEVFINIYTIWYLFNTTIISMGLIYARYFKRYNKYCSIS